MKLNCITNALDKYIKTNVPNATGHILGKEYTVPSAIGAFKKHSVELFYHTVEKNTKVFHFQLMEKSADKNTDEFYYYFLQELFINLEKIKDEIIQI